jgi:hypothetical protein
MFHCTARSTLRPKYVALDTSTWVKLLKHRTDPEVRDIVEVLNTGHIIPYVCFEHVLELLQYDNQKLREQRLDFLGEFRLIGFPKLFLSPPWRNSPLCGSYLDVQEFEISALLKDPSLSLEQVVDRARPDVFGGLSSGMDFANDVVFRDIARTGRATSFVELNRAAASMIHSYPLNPKEAMPKAGDYTMLDQHTAEQLRPLLATALAEQFRLTGDPRLQNPEQLAANIINQSLQRLLTNYDISGEDPFRELVSSVLGVDLSRLPAKATRNDFVVETLYRSRMASHEKRMRLPDGVTYRQISRDRVPSMVAWFAFDHAAKSNQPIAEGSNMIDFPLAALALYIDKVQVDRRILHQAQMIARKNPFLERIRENVFRTRDRRSLLGVLKSF